MKGDFSRTSFDERKHYIEVLLQQGRVQLDADWNEAAAIATRRDERALRDVVGACGSPDHGFQIAARMTIDPMESVAGWTAAPPAEADLCVDYVDYLRGTGSLRVTGATEVYKALASSIALSGDAVLTFAVKSATPLPRPHGTQNDTGFSFFVADSSGRRATRAVLGLNPQTVGAWRVYTCPVSSASRDADFDPTAVTRIGFTSLQPGWVYHFDSIQRDFAPPSVPLRDILALDAFEDLSGWSVPPPGTGGVGLDGSTLFEGRPTVKITGPGDALKTLVQPRDLRAYARVVTVTSQVADPGFFLAVAGGTTRIKLEDVLEDVKAPGTVNGWTTHVGKLPAGADLTSISGYGFEGVASGATLNVARVHVVLNLVGNFFVLGGDADGPGRLYVNGIACQKESAETYYNQRAYPDALRLDPSDNRVDLVYVDVWQRHVTYLEDPQLREVALGGPDTCTRVQTVAQVKVLRGDPDTSTARLECGSVPQRLKGLFAKLAATGAGTLSTLVSPPRPPDDLCQITPDADYLGLDNRLYRVEIHDPGTVKKATFKWSRDNGAIAVAVVEDVLANQTPQTVRVERLGRDRATTFAVGDLVEIADDLSDLGDAEYATTGTEKDLPVRRPGELRKVESVDPDANEITLDAKLTRGYTVARHARVRRWDGKGTAAFVDTKTTPQLDFGDGVQVSFDGTGPMQTGDYWQFTARGVTGQVERLDHALPAGVVHHFCPLALIKWKKNASGQFEIVDVADCRPHLPALTDLEATDVGYDDSCCDLTEDARTLARWQGDVVDGAVTNVQQALDTMCERETRYLVLRYVSGDGQEGLPGETLPADLIVVVENVLGEPQGDVLVDFTVSLGGGSLATLPAKTDSAGQAKVTWTLGTTDGLHRVTASLNRPQVGTPQIIFNARVLCADKICYHDTPCNLTADFNRLGHAGSVDTVQEALTTLCEREDKFLVLRYVGGDGQEGPPGKALPADLIVAVENVLGEPQKDVEVAFAVTQGGGSLSPLPAKTDVKGQARVTWTLGAAEGLNLVTASLSTLQAWTPEIIFNARGVVPAGGGLCTITVGDGERSHGELNGYEGLLTAIDRVRSQGGGTICILRGTYPLPETIVVANARNLVIHGNRLETTLVSSEKMALRFEGCNGVELRDLQVLVQAPGPQVALDGLVSFTRCMGVVVERCRITGQNAQPNTHPHACLLVQGTSPIPVATVPTVIRDNQFVAAGAGPLGGLALRDAVAAGVVGNTVEILAEAGGYGVDLDEGSDGCLVADNRILGMPPTSDMRGSLGGVHVGSGCDGVVVRDNNILGGAGFGVGLGSTKHGKSLGGLQGLVVQGNVIKGMALSGVGVLGFAIDPQPPRLATITNDLLISGNRIVGCAFGEAPVITFKLLAGPKYRLAGGVALWMGEDIRLIDNEIEENGRAELTVAPHPVGGFVLAFQGPNVTVSRNRIVRNFSPSDGNADEFRSGGAIVCVHSFGQGENETGLVIADNEVIAPKGPALSTTGAAQPVLVADNHLEGQHDDAVVFVSCEDGTVRFTGNKVVSRLTAPELKGAVRINARHTVFSANQCVSTGAPPEDHVVITGESASATGNHCLESATSTAARSLFVQCNAPPVAVANVTTKGLELSPPDPATNLANISGVPA